MSDIDLNIIDDGDINVTIADDGSIDVSVVDDGIINLTLEGITRVASDHGIASTDEIINVSYGTGDPPAANTTTIGSLFIKYTA